jgi:ABC-type branched-subunit amino acid transport system substrate-binding protein
MRTRYLKLTSIILTILMIVAVLGTTVLGCGGGEEEDVKEFKIGVITPLSGPAAHWGVGMYQQIQLAAEDVNEGRQPWGYGDPDGGFTVNGQKYMIKVIAVDDEGNASKTVTIANDLIFNQKVNVIIGSMFDDATLALQGITEANNIPLFAIEGSTTALRPENPNTMAGCMNVAGDFYTLYYKFIREAHPEWKTYVDIGADSVATTDFERWRAAYDSLYGYNELAALKVDPSATDFRAVLTQAIAMNPDWLGVGTEFGAGQTAIMIKQARELGWEGPCMQVNMTGVQGLVDAVGAGSVSVLDNCYDPMFIYDGEFAPEGMVPYREHYIERWGAAEWDGVIMQTCVVPFCIEGAKIAGSVDPETLAAGILAVPYVNSPMGKVIWGGKALVGVDAIMYCDGMGAAWSSLY